MKPLKIAFFIDILIENMDGVTNTSSQIISKLDKLNIEPLFISCLPPTSKDFKYRIITCPHIKFPYAKDYPFAISGKKKSIFSQLDAFQPQLIHWSSPSLLGKYATEYSITRSIPNVTIYHSHFSSYVDYLSWIPLKRYIKKILDKKLARLYAKANMILAPTISMKEFLKEKGTDVNKIEIWGRGIDNEKFNPKHRSKNLIEAWNAKDKFKILFVSRLIHYKETDMMIRLSKILNENTVLIITGEGPEKQNMERGCDKEKTIFTGKLVGEKLSEVYASADVFVFPSLTDTFGNVVLEAMSSGLPVLAANKGGPKNIIQNEKTGYLLEPRNEKVFNEKINYLMNDNQHYEQIRNAALNYTKTISWDSIINQLYQYYTKLLP